MSEKDVEEKALETPSSEESANHNTSDDSEPEAALVVPPDGGWGWVVVVASFLCNFVVDGIIFSFAEVKDSIQLEFNVSESEVGLVNSLMSGFYLMCGPFVSALANKFGFRLVTVIGAIIATASFILSYMATGIIYLYIVNGVIGGIGFCMVYMPAVIVVGFYFERWRALATGLSLCGSGVGTFALAPLTRLLINAYGWRMTYIIHGFIILICVVCGLMFAPIEPVRVPLPKKPDDKSKKERLDRLDFMFKLGEKLDSKENKTLVLKEGHGASAHTWMGVAKNSLYPTVAQVFNNLENKDLYQPRRSSATAAIIKSQFTVTPSPQGEEGDNVMPLIKHRPANKEPVVRPFYRDDIFFTGSMQRIPQYKSTTSIGYHLSVTHINTANDEREERTAKCNVCPEAIRRTLATMLDFELLKSPSLLSMAIGGLFTMMGFYVPYCYVPKRAESMGISETTWLLPIIGIANIAGRVACGLISSSENISALWVNNIALTLGGIITCCSSISSSVYYQYFYCFIFGLCCACFASLRSILVVEYMGLERLTNAFGILLLFQGLGATFGLPIAGAIFSLTKDYAYMFYLAGTFLIFSGVISYPLNMFSRWEASRNTPNLRSAAV